MIKDAIARLVREAAVTAMERGALPTVPLPEVTVDRPRLPEHGDYMTNLPLRLQKTVRGKPLEIAEQIRACLPASPTIGSVEVAPQGFINFRLDDRWLADQVDAIRSAGESFADSDGGQGERVQVEFVSANPTGPLTVGNGRGAVFGSTLAAVLEATGHRVEREYYVNDAGNQVETFGRTLYARYQQLFGREVEIPPDGYPGEYMRDLARTLREEMGDRFLRPEGEPAPPELGQIGIDLMVRSIRDDLAALGVQYDVWFRERDLYAPEGLYEQTMALLRERGMVTEKEGAIWFTSGRGADGSADSLGLALDGDGTRLQRASVPDRAAGEDKDNVLVRSNGAPTYFASDIAYHYGKFVTRGFNRVIDIWGADHHGHIARLKAAMDALGIDPDRLIIMLYQLVFVRRGGEIVRLSKRAGEIILLRDLMEEVGLDACRFFFLQRSADATVDFDIDLAKTQSDKNPVYYVQYAHARTCAILRRAAEHGLSPEGGDVRLLTHPAELALVRKMLHLPEVLDQIARTLEPHHLPYYAVDLATTFNTGFYRDVPVLPRARDGGAAVPPELSRARLKLVDAARIALARSLHLMGMTAPERMVREESADEDEA